MDESHLIKIGYLLRDQNRPLKERFRALFTLKNLGGKIAIEQISSAFTDPSALLKHELAYCLGQMKDKDAIPSLIHVLKDTSQEPMVRHEAGEALGAIGCPSVVEVLKQYSNDPVVEVAETCQLALGRLHWLESNENLTDNQNNIYNTIDPTPPSQQKDISELEQILLDEKASLYERYRAIFSLRNLNTADSAKVLAKGFKGSSALFRHEIGYVLGQMACDAVVEELGDVVKDKNESEMVRHEAAEALGSIATEEAMTILNEFLRDDARVVRESCEVALDMSEYERSSEFQYADALLKVK